MFRVLYDDSDMLVIEKPEGIATIPERTSNGRDVFTVLRQSGYSPLYVVHRLDKLVSGVLIFAKNPETHRYLNALFAKRKIAKHYIAIVSGYVKEKYGEISVPIRRFGSGRMGVDTTKGKQSITYFRRLAYGENCSMLAVFPLTGRPHQIRVHLYYRGHPIIGDPLYGDKKTASLYPRLFLHCLRIQLTHPKNQKICSFRSSLPSAFCATLQRINNSDRSPPLR